MHVQRHSHNTERHSNNRVDGHDPRTEGFDPKKFSLPSDNFTPTPLPHVDRVDIGSHCGWDPTLIRPTFAK